MFDSALEGLAAPGTGRLGCRVVHGIFDGRLEGSCSSMLAALRRPIVHPAFDGAADGADDAPAEWAEALDYTRADDDGDRPRSGARPGGDRAAHVQRYPAV